MLTTPYKVLIAASSLLLLAAVGHRAVDTLGGGGSTPAGAGVRNDATADARAGDGGPAASDATFAPMPPAPPVPPVPPPPRRSDPTPPPPGAAPAGQPDPVAAALASLAPESRRDDRVPTLVIGRQPGEPRRPDRPREEEPEPDATAAAGVPSDAGVDPAVDPVYVVRPGDSLQRIARRVLGDANRWAVLRDLNPGIDPLRLQVGDRLRVPAGAALEAAAAATLPATGGDAAAAAGVHRVQPGDSLSVIALRYYGDSTRWKAIYEANRSVMDSPDDLGIGVELRIPPADADR